MDYIEVTGKTVEEAITNACTQLVIPSSKLDYEVIDKGSNGIFGLFNSKPVKIKAKVKNEEVEESEAAVKENKTESKPAAKTEPKSDNRRESKPQAKSEYKKDFKKEPRKEYKKDYKSDYNKSESQVKSAESGEDAAEVSKHEEVSKAEPLTEEQKQEVSKEISEFLNTMFKAMQMDVKINISFETEDNSVYVDLVGDNMGVLIGKRGQTLDSIQYLTSLVINKNRDKYVRIKIDTENYRKRRKETLESLAKNIAYKVKRSRRPVSLEPMNPYERRIIHSALQSDKFVSTRSEGEEPFRHVVVYLEKDTSRYSR